jgi:myo-inositol-1(or 4)-monophosphatase
MKSFNADLNVVLQAVRKASMRVSRDFYELEKLQISKKGLGDFVTTADIKAEKIIIEALQKARPEYSFLTEETGFIEKVGEKESGKIEYKWIIDPIDGTFNFMNGIPFFCISIALVKIEQSKSSILLGVVCSPSNNEIFWAGQNMGAFVINHLGTHRKIKVTAHDDFERMICATYDNKHFTKNLKEYVNYFRNKHGKVRVFGSSALELAYLADGRINLLIQGRLNVWDYAAGLLIVTEAGGVVHDLEGEEFLVNVENDLAADTGIIAGNIATVINVEKNYKDAK